MSDQIESFYKGDTKSWVLTFTRNGSVIDLTADGGATVYMTIKAKKSDADGASDGLQITVTDGSALGVATCTISYSQSNALSKETTYYYDFRLVEGGGTVSTVPGGSFTVKEPITQAVT